MSSASGASNLPQDVQAYLHPKHHYSSGVEKVKSDPEVKVETIAKKSILKTKVKAADKECQQKFLLKTKAKMESKPDYYATVEITDAESKEFVSALKILGSKYGGMSSDHKNDIALSNGKTLRATELDAIYIYTTDHYRLIKGTMTEDVCLETWKADFIRSGLKEPEKQAALAEAQSYVPIIAKTLASAINKLPVDTEHPVLYRGDAVKLEELRKWQSGEFNLIKTPKFFSCSLNIKTAESFATSVAHSKSAESELYVPVLYVIHQKTAKDISSYSAINGEEERIYTPGKYFKPIGMDGKTVPGLTVVYLEELDIAEEAQRFKKK